MKIIPDEILRALLRLVETNKGNQTICSREFGGGARSSFSEQRLEIDPIIIALVLLGYEMIIANSYPKRARRMIINCAIEPQTSVVP